MAVTTPHKEHPDPAQCLGQCTQALAPKQSRQDRSSFCDVAHPVPSAPWLHCGTYGNRSFSKVRSLFGGWKALDMSLGRVPVSVGKSGLLHCF